MRAKTRQLAITVPAVIWDVINAEAEKAERRLAAMGVGHYVGAALAACKGGDE